MLVKNRWLILAATSLFSARCLIEFALIAHASRSEATRGSLLLARDVSYGLLTCLYLLAITIYASKVSSPDDKGKVDTQDIRANVRRYIDIKLNDETQEASREARPFLDIMEEVEEDFENDTDGLRARFYTGSTLSNDANKQTIEEYFRQLRSDYGHFGSGEDAEPALSSPYQSTTSLVSSIGRRFFGAASDPNMRGTVRLRRNRSLLDIFQGGRKSAPPAMTGHHEDEHSNINNDNQDPVRFDTATISEWTRTEYNMSRRGSVARSQRYSSAPSRPLATHMESQYENIGRDSRVFTDPTALNSVQERWELDAEPAHPQEPRHEAVRRPEYPLPGSPRLRRQRPSYRDRVEHQDGGFEMDSYRPYNPGSPDAAGSSNTGTINPYAIRTRSLRRQRNASDTGMPATPYLQQATPRVPSVNGQYTATPDQAQHEQALHPPGVPPAGSQPDDVSDRLPHQAHHTQPTTGPDSSEPLLQPQEANAANQSGTPQRTMRFQVGGRNRRPAAGRTSPVQGEGS